jgi:DNA ligase-1
MIVKRPKEYDETQAKFPALVSPKLDGVRAVYKNGKLYTRTDKEIKGVSHITDQLKNFKTYIFDGELTVPGANFDAASGLIRNHKEEPSVVYTIFDNIVPFIYYKYTRVKLLEKLITKKIESDTIKIIETYEVENNSQLFNFYNWFLQRGFEGLIYYQMMSLYNNKKNYEWMKLFPNKSEDCKVIGFEEGEGKNKYSLGALIVDYKGKPCKVGTGFKEKYGDNYKDYQTRKYNNRRYIWINQPLFLGKYCECIFKEETKDGKMRQPRFKGWRWDKE